MVLNVMVNGLNVLMIPHAVVYIYLRDAAFDVDEPYKEKLINSIIASS